MYNVTVEMYSYQCKWDGIKPELDFSSHTLDPKSVTIELETYNLKDYRVQMSNQSIVIRGRVQSWKGHDPLRKVGDRVKIDIGRYLEPPPSMYREEIQNLRVGKTRFAHGINTILYPCKSILYINWKEYPFEYLKEHMMDMKVLFDQIRTDTLLEEIDG
jgi:hypothetical protein